ncbi:MaoC family dehydratase [Rhodococcus sp. KBS0724]|uniref:FAS1-like dehydratase domain-containing protein n=1 Tax=Rhodococcus sp. KBS0724 TaxID=1179674 RepID=UPI00110F5316|nr:MaoC family dehydratase N-terminal domain-containing protein [Rhodococcus sp. KBS0724]TSD40326.1 MaoC family dehydratase [Rhodococcus sp. KBS0724]
MSYQFPVERGKIREFARAAHAGGNAYQGPDTVVPPTFLTTARLGWAPEGENPSTTLGFDVARVLHAEEEYIFHARPPRAGDLLTVTSRLGRQYEKQGRRGGTMRFAVTVTEFRNSEGDLVAEQHTTIVETGMPSDGS